MGAMDDELCGKVFRRGTRRVIQRQKVKMLDALPSLFVCKLLDDTGIQRNIIVLFGEGSLGCFINKGCVEGRIDTFGEVCKEYAEVSKLVISANVYLIRKHNEQRARHTGLWKVVWSFWGPKRVLLCHDLEMIDRTGESNLAVEVSVLNLAYSFRL